MRNFSYLKQKSINSKGYFFSHREAWLNQLVIVSERDKILMSQEEKTPDIIILYYMVWYIRKTLFPNKRFYWKRKRRVGL